jgi:hypothetical protein
MAETYLTPTFQNAAKPPADAPAATAPDATAPAPPQTGGEQYQTPTFKKAVAPQQEAGGDQTQQTTGAQPGDWSTVAANEAAMYSLPGLRAQAAAARQRLGPVAAASADVAGNFGSPTTALNFVPYVGPELAGGLHEGIKSYNSQPDWVPNSSELAQIAKDTAGGIVGGLVGHGAGKAIANPELLKLGAGGIGTAIAHKLPAWFPGQELMGAAGGYALANKAVDWTSEKLSSPAAQAAIRSLVQGGTAAARASSPGPLWDQWVPGQ